MTMIMNFDGHGINEYEQIVVAHDGVEFSCRQPTKLDLQLKNWDTHLQNHLLEFKALSSHLWYLLLSQNNTLPVIIVDADLNEGQI